MSTVVDVSRIRTDGGTQSRVQINWIVAGEYAADMKAGDEFPPIVVFADGDDYWLADGFHRLEAARTIDVDHISADVRQGTVRDARLYSLGANKNRGLRLSNADKKKIVTDMLNDEEWREWADREIARHCGVSHMTVNRHRESICNNVTDRTNGHRKAKRNGTTYTVDTTNIGKAKEPEQNDQPALIKDEPTVTVDTAFEDSYIRSESGIDHTVASTDAVDTTGNDQLEPTIPDAESIISIHNMDAQYLSTVIDDEIELVVTSPPYNVGIDYDYADDELATYTELITAVWHECYKVMAEGGRIAVVVPFGVGRNPYIPLDCQIMSTLQDAGFVLRGRIVWDKNTTGNRTTWGSFRLPTSPHIRDTTECIIVAHKGDGVLSIPDEVKLKDSKGTHSVFLSDSDYFTSLSQDHWEIAPESARRIGHPAPFPVELAERLIHFYAYPGARILDPFAGSGTVGVAAKQLGCDAELFEISGEYCSLAKERIGRE